MTQIDVILLITLGGFVLAGLWFGFIHMVGSLVGLALGAVVASRSYEAVATLWVNWFGGNLNLVRLLAFFALFVLVNRLVGLLAHIAEKALKLVSFIPFVKTFNRLLGAAFGLLEGAIVLGLVIYFASRYPVSQSFADDLMAAPIAKAVFFVGTLLAPLVPKAVQMLHSVL
jgi:membrane protein required for colicin V production